MGRELLSAADLRARRRDVVMAVVLAAATLAAFGRVAGNGFVDYDDESYVVQMPFVRDGLNVRDARWALTTTHAANWHPLTWLSLQLDASLGRLNPAQYHLTSLLLHGTTALLLFGVLGRMTAAAVPSLLAAALFALHPLRVESVAWVAERKDVLAGLFFVLTLWAYARYAAKPTAARYVAVALALTLGLAAKPMLVTVPFVLLLLDFWPLGRMAKGRMAPMWLVAEKLPLLALAGGSCAVTVWAQRSGGAFTTLENWGLDMRLLNAVVAYRRYLLKTLWPFPMVPFYPLPMALPAWQFIWALAPLAGVTLLALWQLWRRPYLLVGWLWFLGMLVPVIGLVQVGAQSMADRYSYLPSIGLFLALAWTAWGTVGRRRLSPTVMLGAALPVVAACAAASWVQVGIWRDSVRLWGHAVEAGPPSHVAHDHLGALLAARGDADAAVQHFQRALEIKPDYGTALNNLGRALADRGRYEEALVYLHRALAVNPELAAAHVNRGMVLARTGKKAEAEREFAWALDRDPAHAEAHHNLAALLTEQGRPEEALPHYEAALASKLGFAMALNGLGVALDQLGRPREALRYLDEACRREPAKARYRFDLAHALLRTGDAASTARAQYAQALRLDPRFPEQAARTAWKLATDRDPAARNGRFAVQLAEQACEAVGRDEPALLEALAAAYAETGRFADATATARRALAAGQGDQGETADALRRHLAIYQSHRPWREPRKQR